MTDINIVEAWANAARQPTYRQAAEHQRTIDIIQGLLQAKTEPEPAASAIATTFEPLMLKKGAMNPSSPVATLWAILCDAVRALGGHEELTARLVGLLNAISQRPDVTDERGHVVTNEWSQGVYWRDLPELAMIFRDYAIEIESDDEDEDDDERDGGREDQAVPLLNATTFGATYLARGKQPIGMSFHAEISLMQGVEVPCQTPKQHRRAAMYVPPAATWILLAGEKIHELCKSDADRKDGAPGATPAGDDWLWGKGRGFSVGRWALWKKRFEEIATISGLSDDVRDIAARAARAMRKVEDQ